MLTFLAEDSSLVIDNLMCWPVSCEGDLQLLKMQPCDHVVVSENKVTHSSHWCVSIFPIQIATAGVEIPIVCVFLRRLVGPADPPHSTTLRPCYRWWCDRWNWSGHQIFQMNAKNGCWTALVICFSFLENMFCSAFIFVYPPCSLYAPLLNSGWSHKNMHGAKWAPFRPERQYHTDSIEKQGILWIYV